MADLSGLPPALSRLQLRMIRRVDALSGQMAAGDITPDQWQDSMRDTIALFMQSAMMTGKGSELNDDEMGEAARLSAVQFVFLDNFTDEIKADGWQPAYTSRAQMYASSTTTSFSIGDVIAQAGQVLPLPSMPAEGTICLSNCGCRWRIVTIDAEAGDFDAYWELHKSENCQTCVQRAAEWSPVRIRDNILQ